MMYSDKLAIAVKSNGKVLRELGDTVYLPFGTEYTIFIKNMNSVRCLVSIEIDGNDIAEGDSFVIAPNSSIEIERFIKNGNRNAGNRFKFIERSGRVEAHRGGPQVEDGLIRVQFEFERVPTPVKSPVYVPPGHWEWKQDYPVYPQIWYGSSAAPVNRHPGVAVSDCLARGTPAGGASGVVSSAAINQFSVSNTSASASLSAEKPRGIAPNNPGLRTKSIDTPVKNEAGITAAGSISEQKFVEGYIGALDGVKHVMVLKLLGEVGQKKVQQAITVKHKPTCTSCGKVNKATAKFCSECGTSLEIV